MSGWGLIRSASSPTRFVYASASLKSANRNSFSRWWSSTTRHSCPRSARYDSISARSSGGRPPRRNPPPPREREDLRQGVPDAPQAFVARGDVLAEHLERREVDHAARVDDEVGRVHDAALGEPVRVLGFGE